jgi:outer membrane protein assembly factor BamB
MGVNSKSIAPKKMSLPPQLRLLVAWVVTLAVLLYAGARTLVISMLAGRPELVYAAMLVAGLVAVIGLTYGLSAALPRFKTTSWLGPLILVPWLAGNGVLVGVYSGSEMPTLALVALYLPATLWVVWAAWMFYAPLSWTIRLGVLALLLAAAASFVLLVRIEGLTGDSDINFAWRWSRPLNEFQDASLTNGSPILALPAKLSETTDHDFAQFLGPRRLGVVPNAHLARDWNKNPPRELWRRPVGAGWSGFAVAGDYAVTQEQRGEQECVVCYRVADGALCWLHADPVRFDSSMGGPGPRATPTIVDGRVYTVGGTGILNCLDGSTGQPIWTVDILKDNQANNIVHGVCGSPLVVDNLVVVSPTGSNGISLSAYDRETGRRLWQGGKDQASYGSPMLATLAGFHQILLFTSEGVAAHEVATGQLLWSFPWTNSERVNCSQPLPDVGRDDQVFVSTGYGKGCALIRVKPSSEGWSVETLWQSRKDMKTKFTTPVFHRGYIYGLDDGILECLNPRTGRQLWKGTRYHHGQSLLAGDLLLVQSEDGPVVLVEPVPEGQRELGRLPALSGKTWNNPALAGRYLLVRNDHEAACYELPTE